MNKERRKQITALFDELERIRGEVEALQNEEQESFDNMPEGLQQSDRGQASEYAANTLQQVLDLIQDAMDELDSIE